MEPTNCFESKVTWYGAFPTKDALSTLAILLVVKLGSSSLLCDWDAVDTPFATKHVAAPSRTKKVYIDFVSQNEPEEVAKFYALKNLPPVFGNETFKDWVKEVFVHLQFTQDIPESRQLAPSPKKIIQLTCRHFKVTKEQVLISKRGRENLPRDIAIYLVRHFTQQTLTSIGNPRNRSAKVA